MRFRVRRLLSLLHAFAVPWAWCGLGLLVVLILFDPARTRWPVGTGPGGAAHEPGWGAWAAGTEVDVLPDETPWEPAWWRRSVRVKTRTNPPSYATFLSPPPTETLWHSDTLGIYLTRESWRDPPMNRPLTLYVPLWWLCGFPAVLGAGNVWRHLRRGGPGGVDEVAGSEPGSRGAGAVV